MQACRLGGGLPSGAPTAPSETAAAVGQGRISPRVRVAAWAPADPCGHLQYRPHRAQPAGGASCCRPHAAFFDAGLRVWDLGPQTTRGGLPVALGMARANRHYIQPQGHWIQLLGRAMKLSQWQRKHWGHPVAALLDKTTGHDHVKVSLQVSMMRTSCRSTLDKACRTHLTHSSDTHLTLISDTNI